LSGIDVRNNIFVALSASKPALSKTPVVPEAALVLNNNLYYAPSNTSGRYFTYNGSTYTLAQLTAMTGKESLGKQADPQFADLAGFDFRVQPTSPARALGAGLGVLYDFVGTARNTATPTAGAYE
jgi:hypothetical protein